MGRKIELSLADRILAVPENIVETLGIGEARNALRLPWDHLLAGKQNHVSPAHKSYGDIIAKETVSAAQRFRFSAEVAEIASKMISSTIDIDIVLEVARLPALNGWLEWKRADVDQLTFGVLWRSNDGVSFELFCFLRSRKNQPFLAGKVSVNDGFAGRENLFLAAYKSIFVNTIPDLRLIIENSLLPQFYRFFICFCAFVTDPHECKTKWSSPPDNIQKLRAKKGLLPILSFNEVNLAPGRASETHNPCPNDSPSVRFHHRMGHWRNIVRGEKVTKTYVRPHWVGNPRKGIVMKNRNIQPPKAA